MADPTPAELAKGLWNAAFGGSNYDSPGYIKVDAETATDIADALDRLAALEASLTDEWGVQHERHESDGSWTPLTYDADDREDAKDMLRVVTNMGNPPFRNAHLVRRRVTPWEAVPDGE